MVSASLWAHHGTAAFDTSQMVNVKGTVTDSVYLNPHVQVYLECKDGKGQTEKWQGELTAPNKLNRAGWSKHTLTAMRSRSADMQPRVAPTRSGSGN
jgi:Family of unknown function (DUF6152)